MVIMWLSSFAILASYSSGFGFTTYYSYSYWYKQKRATYYTDSQIETAWQTGAAASGIGGIELCVSPMTSLFRLFNSYAKAAALSNRLLES